MTKATVSANGVLGYEFMPNWYALENGFVAHSASFSAHGTQLIPAFGDITIPKEGQDQIDKMIARTKQ